MSMKAPHPSNLLRSNSEIHIAIEIRADDGNLTIEGLATLEPGSAARWADVQSRVQFLAASLLDLTASNLSESELDTLFSVRVK